MNKIMLVGRLVKDPVLRYSEEGLALGFLTVAVPRTQKNEHGQFESDFVSCKMFRGTAEATANYCRKGSVVGITGKITSRAVITDGKKEYITDIIAEQVQFIQHPVTK